ncbi:MAG: hypothetical protein Q8R25_02035, partial [bacterium]|nr:hypothetical protein [bacterium]
AMTVRDPELRGEYWRAIIPFAASAMTYMPLTSGYDEFISAIDAIDETTINSPGTNFLLPILEYEQMLKDHPRKTDSTVDILVFISDGGKDEGVYQDFPYIRAAFQRMQNTVPFTVGIGSVEVTKLPDGTEIRKSQKVPLVIINREGKVEGYLYEDPKDPKSERQYSELDERTLASIAGSPDRYIHYTGKEVFLQKLKHIIIENRKLVNTIPHTRTAPVAQWFLVPAILIACIMLGYFRRLFSLLFSLVMFFSSKVSKAFGSSRHNI